MNSSLRNLYVILGLAATAALLLPAAARAESPFERDQREQLEKYQREHGLSPEVQRRLRWEKEWREQHPNEPMPNAGVLQKMHRQEIIATTNQDFAQMRQRRQTELQHNYLLSKQRQQRLLDAQHITWTPQQWKEWDREYDREQRQQAEDYLKAVAQAGEMSRTEAAREEQERIRRSGN
jgi:hypothetical protein